MSPPTATRREGARPGVKVLGTDPGDRRRVTLRDGRFGDYAQGERRRREAEALLAPEEPQSDELTLEQAIRLLSLPREVAKHPESGEPILAGIGRFGPYVQHGKTYANLGRDDDFSDRRQPRHRSHRHQGSGGGRSRFGRADPGRTLGDHPQGGEISVKSGRFGPYVNWGKVNATLSKGTDPRA